MKITKEKLAILIALSLSTYDLSSREIFEAIVASDKIPAAIFTSASGDLDELKKDGLIENGLSEIVNRKTVLMWKITDKGRAVVASNKSEIVEAKAVDESTALLRSIENLEEKIGTLHKLLPIVTDEMSEILLSIIDDLKAK